MSGYFITEIQRNELSQTPENDGKEKMGVNNISMEIGGPGGEKLHVTPTKQNNNI